MGCLAGWLRDLGAMPRANFTSACPPDRPQQAGLGLKEGRSIDNRWDIDGLRMRFPLTL